MAEPKKGYIYVLKEKDEIYYKVGNAGQDSLKQRISNLQTGNPRKLLHKERPYPVTDCTKAEGAARTALIDYKAGLGGGTEWYKVQDDQYADFIKIVEKAVALYRLEVLEAQMIEEMKNLEI